ncbi:MAG: hypothetical protein DRJ41_00765 [Thermoprotei archaeon]|nr:MAG: hypothetical protein DRJ41_00765 [Thermoprotei archaeon]
MEKVTKIPTFNLENNIEIVGFGIFIRDISALVVADFHIGYEEALESQGVHIPAVQYPLVLRIVNLMLDRSDAEKLIILGDVKHEFGEALRQEWKETIDLFTEIKKKKIDIHVIRGNHDNFLIPILKRLEIPFHDPYLKIRNYLFVHGHKPLPLDTYSLYITHIFMGHEHPAVVLRDELGIKIKFKCLLEGDIDGRKLFVLPSISPLMPGTEINVKEDRTFLSPILNEVNIDRFKVYVIDLTAGIYDFGPLGALRHALWSV